MFAGKPSLSVIERCPFVLESDQLRLSVHFGVSADKLTDLVLGMHHQIVAEAEHLLCDLQKGTTLAVLRQEAHRLHITDRQLHELLGFLNVIGGLHRKRRPWQHCQALWHCCMQSMLGVRYPPLAWRRSATLLNVWWGVTRASRPVIVASVFVCTLLGCSGLMTPSAVTVLGLFGIGTFVGSLFVHEFTHVLLITHHKQRAASLLQSGMRLGIIHATLSQRAELTSALAGPAAGMACAGTLAAGMAVLHQPQLALLGACAASFHLTSLLPQFGDGATLRTVCRGNKR